ncbi:hypothetical protein LINPERHAP1_LOCUS22490 [Linum perenne]
MSMTSGGGVAAGGARWWSRCVIFQSPTSSPSSTSSSGSHNALSIFSVLRSEFPDQKADLNLYADPIFALLKNRMIDEIDNLLKELDAAAEDRQPPQIDNLID